MYAAASVFLVIASVQIDYDDRTFGLNASDSAFILVDNSGFIPHPQGNYEIQNIGRTKVDAEVWYGTELQWLGIIEAATIYPGEKRTLHDDDRPYYFTGVKIINQGAVRAIVHGERGNLESPYIPNIHLDWSKILQRSILFSVKYIKLFKPLNFVLKQVIHMFWPTVHNNVWKEISDKIYLLLDERIRELISSLLENEINVYRDKMLMLIDELHNKSPINQHYMNLAEDFVGLEQKFKFSSTITNYHDINFYILPLYSNVVSLKVHFYTMGIRYANQIGLTDYNVSDIKNYANITVENGIRHISKVSKYATENAYNTSEAERIFDNMMAVRTHLAIHGEEYIPIWKYRVKNPSSDSEIYNPVISYSMFFGKPTANLYAQATPVEVPQPLCPKLLMNGSRNKLTKIVIFLWVSDHTVCKIGGAKLSFGNGDMYTMGTVTSLTDSFELENEKIIQLSVYGEGKIDGLKFVLSNGTEREFGQTHYNSSKDFTLQDHHIPSFYLSSDSTELNGQAANIAVSFQWHVKTN